MTELSESGRYIDTNDLEEHDTKHRPGRRHSPIVIMVIVGAVAVVAAASILFITASSVTTF